MLSRPPKALRVSAWLLTQVRITSPHSTRPPANPTRLPHSCVSSSTDQRLAEQYFAILFSLLGEGPPKGVGQYALHTFAIQRLKDLGPLHIAAMRSVVLADPQKKARLERALQTGSSLPSATTGQQKTPATAAPRAPAITLRQDFSNFAF